MGASYCNKKKVTFLIQDIEGVNKAKKDVTKQKMKNCKNQKVQIRFSKS